MIAFSNGSCYNEKAWQNGRIRKFFVKTNRFAHLLLAFLKAKVKNK